MGNGYGMGNNYNIGHNNFMGYGNGMGGYQTDFMGFLFQALFVGIIIILVVAAVVWVKNYIASEEAKRNLYYSQYENISNGQRKMCKNCGKDLNRDWKVCPHCGKDAVNQ
jgi:hypothetical protein